MSLQRLNWIWIEFHLSFQFSIPHIDRELNGKKSALNAVQYIMHTNTQTLVWVNTVRFFFDHFSKSVQQNVSIDRSARDKEQQKRKKQI